MLYSVDSDLNAVVNWVVGGLFIGWRKFKQLTHHGRHIGEVVFPYVLEVVHDLAVVSTVEVKVSEAQSEKKRVKPTVLQYNRSL